MNAVLPRSIIALITSKDQSLGYRPEFFLNGKEGRILLGQIRTVDRRQLKNKLGGIELEHWLGTLIQMPS